MFIQYVRDYDGTAGLHFVILSHFTECINKHKHHCLRVYAEFILHTDTNELSQVRTTMRLRSISCH